MPRPELDLPGPATNIVLVLTSVEQTRTTLLGVLQTTVDEYHERARGLFEIATPHGDRLLQIIGRNLSKIECSEVRAVILSGQQGDALLAEVMAAPTLAQLTAEVDNLDLLSLFASELASFRSVYQPIVNLTDGAPTVIGFEALLRARSNNTEHLPDNMFAAAERAGWSHVLDRVGRSTALRCATGWLDDALLFVNLLPTTVARPETWFDTTAQEADKAGIRLDRLVLELTENELVQEPEQLAEAFAYYRARGCKVAIDDLGAGYSSLNLLVQLEPDIVKLDMKIVQQLPEPASRSVIAAVVDITHAYGGQVLAEGVETAEQAAAVRELGVDLGQGWFFGYPEERMNRPSVDDTDVAVDSIGPFSYGRHRGTADVEALLAPAIRAMAAGVSIVDAQAPNNPLIYVNEAFRDMTGYLYSEVIGNNCRFLQGPDTDAAEVRIISNAVAAGEEYVGVLLNYREDGTPWWNELRLSPVRNGTGTLTHYFGFQNDVTARVEAEMMVSHLATHDTLTGLPNRAGLRDGLERELARAVRDGTHVAVLFIDLDWFKQVNDSLGHEAGDRALAAAAARLRLSLRREDLLARVSGDEFVAVIPDIGVANAEAITHRATDRVLASFDNPLDESGLEIRISASIGVALFPLHGETSAELMRAADTAMYTAKTAGRGRAALALPHPSTDPPDPTN